MPDTRDTIAQLRRLLEQATPGPWEYQTVEDYGTPVGYVMFGRSDAQLIAAAVNALPDLLDRLEALEDAALPFAKAWEQHMLDFGDGQDEDSDDPEGVLWMVEGSSAGPKWEAYRDIAKLMRPLPDLPQEADE